MKNLLNKDKKIRLHTYLNEKKHFTLKLIFKNYNFFTLLRWFASVQLELLVKNNSKTLLINRCLLTVNKKRFNKLTIFSRHVFLKLIRKGYIVGMKKSSW